MTGEPLSAIGAEATRLVDEMGGRHVVARLIGGLGVAAHDHVAPPPSLVREFADIDLVVPRAASRSTAQALAELGYTANARFNALHGATRLLFYDLPNRRQLDVFVGEFAMCHRLELEGRLDRHPTALAAADLLLTKLQIVELNQKDVLDAARLLLSHELTDDDADSDAASGADGLSQRRILSVTATDWGWHTTLSDNLAKVARGLPDDLAESLAAVVVRRAELLLAVMAQAPKSARWKARALIGRRKAWYELPEEVAITARPRPTPAGPERTARG
jgi:hypothetical protein